MVGGAVMKDKRAFFPSISPAGTESTRAAYVALADASLLQERLNRVFSGVESKDVVVGISVDGDASVAALGRSPRSGGLDVVLSPGCLTKLFTATLLEQLISRGALSPDDRAESLLGGSVRTQNALEGISLRHLLEHSHGLDDSSCLRVPRRQDGFIDVESVLTTCSRHRLNMPGELYSYSNAGAWVAAAIVEVWHGRPYEDILQSELFDSLGIRLRPRVGIDSLELSNGICPATGGALAISCRDLFRFLVWANLRKCFWPESVDRPEYTPLPGWNPLERGVYRAWKVYGSGWYGHNSIADDGSSIFARVNPEGGIVVVVSSARYHAGVVAAKVFGKSFPGYSTLSTPRQDPRQEASLASLDSYCGSYCNAAETISVQMSESGSLRLVSRTASSDLSTTDADVFVVDKSPSAGTRFVQFLGRNGTSFRYLWDGRRVLRRTEVSAYDRG
jgi:CubicO group peptidase (beta-lactamase class C family)